jgi:hypothetical protein
MKPQVLLQQTSRVRRWIRSSCSRPSPADRTRPLSERVWRVLDFALRERTHTDAHSSPDDEVLTLEFQHTFSREQVAQVLAVLP